MLALLPLLFTTSTALAAAVAEPGMSLFARQTSIPPTTGCTSACTALENVVETGDTSPATLCSSQVVSDYTSCYDCIVSDGAITQADAQEAVDGYVSDCSTLGFPVGDITISGGGSSGSGTASSEAGTTVGSSGSGTVSSGTGTTVRSGSTATASAAESTSTATSGGSSSSTTDSGSSSSSSSSSSGDSSSSSGDSDGLPSGSGFKTGSSSRLHTTPAALFAVLSVAVFWHL